MIRENGNVLIIADDRKFLGGIVRIIEKTTAAGVKLSVESVPFDRMEVEFIDPEAKSKVNEKYL